MQFVYVLHIRHEAPPGLYQIAIAVWFVILLYCSSCRILHCYTRWMPLAHSSVSSMT